MLIVALQRAGVVGRRVSVILRQQLARYLHRRSNGRRRQRRRIPLAILPVNHERLVPKRECGEVHFCPGAHGILHLLGYDHAEPEEHREMFGLQDELLAAWRATDDA